MRRDRTLRAPLRASEGAVSRYLSIDLARTLAIVGMLALHALPQATVADSPILSEVLGFNRPQLLFAVLDGTSIGLIARSAAAAGMKKTYVYQSVSIRAVTLIAVGLLLASLNSGVIVILDYYGIFLLLALPFLFASTRVLVIWTIAIALGGPLAVHVFGLVFDGTVFAMPFQPVLTWLLWGQYPAIVWLAYVLLGLTMWRIGFSDWPKMFAVLVAFTALSGIMQLLLTDEDSIVQETARNIQSGLIAAALVYLLTLLTRSIKGVAQLALRPFVAMGILPISTYVLHVIIISFAVGLDGVSRYQSASSFVHLLLLCALCAAVWSMMFPRGPLESWTHWMASREMGSSGEKRAD